MIYDEDYIDDQECLDTEAMFRKGDKMKCPKCKKEMCYEDGIHRPNVRTHYCASCDSDIEIDEDITGDLIDQAMLNREREGGKDE